MPASNATADADRNAAVGALLDRVASTLHGLVEVGTLLCFSGLGETPRLFIKDRLDVLNALVVVLTDLLKPMPNDEPLRGLLETLAAAVRRVSGAMLSLEQFQR